MGPEESPMRMLETVSNVAPRTPVMGSRGLAGVVWVMSTMLGGC